MQHIKPVLKNTFTDCMEQLQEAYVGSVAATAGCSMNRISRDTYGYDVMLVRPAKPGIEESSIYAQLKNTTTIKPDLKKSHFSYQFGAREHMERLTAPRKGIKAILLVMVTSPDQALWTTGDHNRLEMLHCCYWRSLEGVGIPEGVQKPTVHVPVENRLTANSLLQILDATDRGDSLNDFTVKSTVPFS